MTEATAVLVRMALISHGSTMSFGNRGGDSGRIMPPGERRPMHEVWGERIDAAPNATARADVVEQARNALTGYIRRQFVVTATESYDDLAERIVTDGWGLDADECARAMRCTPTLVKRARLGAARHPDTGYTLPDELPDRMAWARELRADGLSLRDVQTLTGLAKSTLHDRLR